ncbi:hypothetical protein [Puerhibacterium puerhi]|uniref:hypothetical protein n=1 Tax=Puerhibacterium puerhi TaxID=2692623 RepID=UPI00135CF1E1|nr:hypothetical protein [Puerhibacterium puerhi]
MASEEGLSITLKRRESERYAQDGTWLVAHGSPESIKRDLGKAFGVETDGLTLVQLVTEVERLWRQEDSSKPRRLSDRGAKGEDKVFSLDGTPPADSTETPVDVAVRVLDGEVIEEKADDPWADATPATNPPVEEPKREPVFEAIEAATSKSELQQVFLKFKSEFARPDVAAAAKARTEALNA